MSRRWEVVDSYTYITGIDVETNRDNHWVTIRLTNGAGGASKFRIHPDQLSWLANMLAPFARTTAACNVCHAEVREGLLYCPGLSKCWKTGENVK